MKTLTLRSTLILTAAALWLAAGPPALAADPSATPMDGWVVNGTVSAIVRTVDTTYLGGAFTMIGPNRPYGVPLDLTSGLPVATYPKPNGAVRCCAPDGAGGWYIGGDFTRVGAFTRNRLAHIKPDGTVDDAWNPDAGSTVNALAVSGSTVYVGGAFTTLGGTSRNRLAAISTDGTLAAWDPTANGTVNALAVSDSTVYVGGAFTTIGGSPCGYLAQFGTSSTTVLVSSANPSAYGSSVTFTATVAPAAASGTVTFKDGATTLGTGTLSGGTATYSTSALSAGSHSITAEYGGDADYATSTSSALTQTVNKATPNVTTWPTATAITYDQTLASSTLSGGAATPTGSFAWTTSSTAPNAGTASQSVTFTPTDTGNYTTVIGTADVTVNKADQTITFGTLVAKTVGDAPSALTATASSGLTVSYVSSVPGVASVAGSTVTSEAAGTTNITASQAGDGNYNAATSVTQSLTVMTAAFGTRFKQWISGNTTLTGANSNPDADPDSDGVSNMMEYALGTNPQSGSSGTNAIAYAGTTITTHGQPIPRDLSPGTGGVDYRAVFGRRKDYQAAGLTYTMQFSADSSHWVDSTAQPGDVQVLTTIDSVDGTIDAVSVPYPRFIPVPTGYRKPTFFRIGVTSN
jgi:hypothetical protein